MITKLSQDLLAAVQALNPSVKLDNLNIHPDGFSAVWAGGKQFFDASLESACAKFAAYKPETERERVERELLEHENHANQLRAKLEGLQ